MSDIQFNPAYLFAAGHGHCKAQSDLALACRNHATSIAADNPMLADEYFTAAETFVTLAISHGDPHDIAVKASIFVDRSLHSAARDPVRSLQYREEVETFFDQVEESAHSHALGVAVLALNKLADADPADDRASVRLNRIIEALPPAEAQLVGAVVCPARCDPQKEKQ